DTKLTVLVPRNDSRKIGLRPHTRADNIVRTRCSPAATPCQPVPRVARATLILVTFRLSRWCRFRCHFRVASRHTLVLPAPPPRRSREAAQRGVADSDDQACPGAAALPAASRLSTETLPRPLAQAPCRTPP